MWQCFGMLCVCVSFLHLLFDAMTHAEHTCDNLDFDLCDMQEFVSVAAVLPVENFYLHSVENVWTFVFFVQLKTNLQVSFVPHKSEFWTSCCWSRIAHPPAEKIMVFASFCQCKTLFCETYDISGQNESGHAWRKEFEAKIRKKDAPTTQTFFLRLASLTELKSCKSWGIPGPLPPPHCPLSPPTRHMTRQTHSGRAGQRFP